MKKSPSVSQLGSIILGFISKYHVVIFSLTVVIGVSIAILSLNNLINLSNETDGALPAGVTFDKETIERINGLRLPGESQDNFSLPTGRVNPFIE